VFNINSPLIINSVSSHQADGTWGTHCWCLDGICLAIQHYYVCTT